MAGLSGDDLRALLAVEPFWLSPDAAWRLTYRELWEWYFARPVAEAKKRHPELAPPRAADAVGQAVALGGLFGVDAATIEKAMREGK